MSNELPLGWRLARFDEILTKVDRKFIIDDSHEYKTVGVRWYGNGTFVRDRLLGANINRKQQWEIREGDIVYNKLFAWKGAFAVADEKVDGCIVSDKFPTYNIKPDLIEPKYLSYFFTTPNIALQAQDFSKGAAALSKLTLNPPQFWDLKIPLPSLSEQRRIVERIESLSSRIAKTQSLREEATAELEALIDSILGNLLEVKKSDWVYGFLPEFADINPSRKDQVTLKAEDLVSFVPMRAVDDVTGAIVRAEPRTYQEVSKGYTWFQDGDVIFAKITPCMENGKSAIAKNLISGTAFGSTEFHVLRPGNNILAEWLYILVRSKQFKDDAAAHFKGTAGQQRVPQSFLKNKIIPVPPLDEQRRIVAYLDSVQARLTSLRELQSETQKELDALLPSVLDKAFKGEF